MYSKLAIGFGVAFFLLVPLGGYAKLFPLFIIGLIGAGTGFILYALFVHNANHQNKWVYWLYRIVVLGLGCLALTAGLYNSLDLPYYFNEEYETIEGVPSEIIYHEPSRGDMTGTFSVTIDEQTFNIDRQIGQNIKDLEHCTFIIKYLPRSKWILDYQIQSQLN